MPDEDEVINHAVAVKAKYEGELMNYPNVVGVGVGMRHRRRRITSQVSIVVTVRRKLPRAQLDPDDVLPTELEGIPVDVLEVGDVSAHSQ